MFEALRCMKRAGADILITYAAKQAAKYLNSKRCPSAKKCPNTKRLQDDAIS